MKTIKQPREYYSFQEANHTRSLIMPSYLKFLSQQIIMKISKDRRVISLMYFSHLSNLKKEV